MKKIILILMSFMLAVSAIFAQETTVESCKARYNKFVEKFGYAGIGVRTVLDEWKQIDPKDQDLLIADFNYYIAACQSSMVVKKPESKYLGMKPMLELKDSTGANIYYYEEVFYDENIFKDAIKAADHAISLYPDELNFRFMKLNAYMAFEKGSPDMALADLLHLAELYFKEGKSWIYLGKEIPKDFFEGAVQDFCYSFYTIGTPSSYAAFLRMSEQMLEYLPNNPVYMDNIGVYQLVAMNNNSKAEKVFKKVLKKYPDDITAISNCIIIARREKDIKKEKRYLKMMVAHGPEDQVTTAKLRLDALEKL